MVVCGGSWRRDIVDVDVAVAVVTVDCFIGE